MGQESFPDDGKKEGQEDPQGSFDFEAAGEPLINEPKVIFRALCSYPDGRYENEDLREGEGGLFYNEAGDAFEKEEQGGKRVAYKLNATAEFLAMQKKVREANPSLHPELIDEYARMRLRDQRRKERLEKEAEERRAAKKRKK